MMANVNRFQGKTILELGSGTGICGIVSSMLGASRIILTDKFQDTRARQLVQDNVDANRLDSSKVSIRKLVWGELNEDVCRGMRVDHIIASDCFYDDDLFEKLLFTVSLVLRTCTINMKHARMFMSYQLRSSSWQIGCLLRRYHLKGTELPFQCSHSSISIFEISAC